MFKLTMITPEGKKYTSENTRISLPTEDGIRTVLSNHMDIIVPVEIGKLKLIKENESDIAVVSEGIFYFQNNVAKLFVRTFEFTDEIDRVRAERARDRAEEMLAQQLDAHEFHEAELALKRALTRLSVTK